MPKKHKYVIDETGRKTAVVLDIASYRALLERIEDLEDALELDEAVRTARSFRPHTDVHAAFEQAVTP